MRPSAYAAMAVAAFKRGDYLVAAMYYEDAAIRSIGEGSRRVYRRMAACARRGLTMFGTQGGAYETG